MTRECERHRQLIHGFLDGELTPDEERAVQEHIASCEGCAGMFEELRGLTEDLDRMSLRFADVRLWEKVRERVLPSGEKKRSTCVFSAILVATLLIYKVVDAAVGFRLAILLKPVVLVVVALLLVLHKQNPFRLQETLNATSSTAPR